MIRSKKTILIVSISVAGIISLAGCRSFLKPDEPSSAVAPESSQFFTRDDETLDILKEVSESMQAERDAQGSVDSGNPDEESESQEPGAPVEYNGDEMLKYLEEMKASHNSRPVDLTPSVGEFVKWDEDTWELVDSPDSDLYGFWQDITDGCSVWCAVNNYDVEVNASSVLAPQGSQKYDAANIVDRTKNNAWVEGVAGSGIGEKISITKSYSTTTGQNYPDAESIFYYELCIVNGIARTDKSWKENNRVKELKFYYNDEYQGTIELADTDKPQYISLSGLNLAAKEGEPSTFSFEILSVYKGDKYDDTGITGIEIAFDSPNH